jgi:excinuclease ABC subunit C
LATPCSHRQSRQSQSSPSSHAQTPSRQEAAIVAGDTKYTSATLSSSPHVRTEPIRNFSCHSLKDDKSYLYIVIDLADPFPRPRLARAHDLPLGRLFGPFPNAKIAEEVLRAIRRLIPFCMAKRVTTHPCFYSRIGLCSPCPSVISSAVEKSQYRSQIRQVIRILEGKVAPVIKDLTAQMKSFSASQDFESALKIRTSIERFTRFITTHSFTDRHFSYNNSSAKLASLQSILGVRPLGRIECYDASNSAMQDSVVSMTVMTNGLLDNGQYRRFKIKNPRAVSDFDRLDEAITRRLKNKTWPQPDLIIIDGGIPQLRRLQRIFDQQTNPPNYLGLAKHPDRLVSLQGVSLKVDSRNPGLQLLQQLRDEAHRFANSYRKILEKKRQK